VKDLKRIPAKVSLSGLIFADFHLKKRLGFCGSDQNAREEERRSTTTGRPERFVSAMP
jgi:hypothetical protein